jgi:hypothetical protein
MFLSSFSDAEQFNNFISEIISSPYVVNYDKHVHTAFSHKQYEIVRSTLATADYDQRIRDIQSLFLSFNSSVSQEDLNTSISLAIESYNNSPYSLGDYYVYPFSKKKFIEVYFSSFMPSFKADLFTYLSDKFSVFTQIGSGSGSAILIKKVVVTSQAVIDDINSSCSLHSRVASISSALSTAVKVIDSQKDDIDFLNAHIDDLMKVIIDVNKELDQERKQGMNGYYKTWH